MRWKRRKYSLRNCNPPEKKKRKKINELDFKTKFPFFSFDDTKVDLMLLKRFLYHNEIPIRYLYNKQQIQAALRDMEENPDPKLRRINRFDLIDI